MANFAIVGAGFVADLYMRSAAAFPHHTFTGVWDINPERLSRFSSHWNVPAARGLEDLFRGPKRPDVLINLTTPQSHYEVSCAAVDAGLNVYSEKPFALSVEEATDLVERARQKGVMLSAAPCNGLGASAQSAWYALRRRIIGTPHLVYAEMDDGYISQAPYAKWASESGAPWPARNEFITGATLEHAGYSLSWLLAMFGPVRRIQAMSATLIKDKLGDGTPNAPDFSVAVLRFDHDVVARLTNSIVASHDHRFRVFGSRGVLSVRDVWDNGARVEILKRHAVRRRLVEGIITRTVSVDAPPAARGHRWGAAAMNFMLGPNDMIEAAAEGREPRLSADYSLHLNELALAMHNAADGEARTLTTTFEPLEPMPWARPKKRRRVMDANAMKLGILGTGAMAANMREALIHEPRLDVTAVCSSTSLARAEEFATEHQIEQAYGDLEAMLASSGIDAIYIANATTRHAESAIAALKAGKAVLLEKPIAVNAADAERVVETARETGTLFMEALWTPFLPAQQRAIALAKGGTLGDPVHLSMEFGYPATAETAPGLFDRDGGGVLLDRMVYPLTLALAIFGPVDDMDAAVTFEDGVDVRASLQLRHAEGGVSQVSASLVTLTSNTATIALTGGLIRMEEPVVGAEILSIRTMGPQVARHEYPESTTAPPPGRATRGQIRLRLRQSSLMRRVNRAVSHPRTETHSFGADQYLPMLSHFAALLADKKSESDIVTHDVSLTIARLAEEARGGGGTVSRQPDNPVDEGAGGRPGVGEPGENSDADEGGTADGEAG